MTNTTQFDEHIAYLTSPKRSKMQQQPIDDTWQLDTDGNEVDDFHDDDCNTTSNDMPTTNLSKQRKKIVVGCISCINCCNYIGCCVYWHVYERT